MGKFYGITPSGEVTECKAADPAHCPYHIRHTEDLETAQTLSDRYNEKVLSFTEGLPEDYRNNERLKTAVQKASNRMEVDRSYSKKEVADLLFRSGLYESISDIDEKTMQAYFRNNFGMKNHVSWIPTDIRTKEVEISILTGTEDEYKDENYRRLFLEEEKKARQINWQNPSRGQVQLIEFYAQGVAMKDLPKENLYVYMDSHYNDISQTLGYQMPPKEEFMSECARTFVKDDLLSSVKGDEVTKEDIEALSYVLSYKEEERKEEKHGLFFRRFSFWT